MQAEYSDLDLFKEDLHNEINIKDTLINMNLFEGKKFKNDFIHCIFHDGDRTPSLQIKDKFWKCYGCNAKGDLIAFIMMPQTFCSRCMKKTWVWI